jgi:hypothetical protein
MKFAFIPIFIDWIISESPTAQSFNVVFRSATSACPDGIRGGYDRNSTFDDSLTIECQDHQTSSNCCSKVVVAAKSKIKTNQGIFDTLDT